MRRRDGARSAVELLVSGHPDATFAFEVLDDRLRLIVGAGGGDGAPYGR